MSLKQACEDEDDKYQLIHIANADLKDVENKHKELLVEQQLWLARLGQFIVGGGW